FVGRGEAARLEKGAGSAAPLGAPRFAAPPRGARRGGHRPSNRHRSPPPATPPPGDPTRGDRKAGEAAQDASQITTESGAPEHRGKNRMRITVAALVMAIGVTATIVILRGKPAGPAEPAPAQLTLSVEPENATILVDGQPAGKQVTHKAGQVQIEVRAEG